MVFFVFREINYQDGEGLMMNGRRIINSIAALVN